MSHSSQSSTPPQTDHPPNPPTNLNELQHGFDSLSITSPPAPSSPPIASSSDRFLCTICVDSPESPLDYARLPVCHHLFCLPCLASWSLVRQLCPNCKASFSTVLCRRALDGSPIQGPPTLSNEFPYHLLELQELQDAPWLQLRSIHSPQHDIEASFSLPPRDAFLASDLYEQPASSAASSSVPRYVNEDVEDELEDHIWQEEEKFHQRLMRTTRTISNRRFGPSGYISSGRMRATPRPAGSTDHAKPSSSQAARHASAASSGKAPAGDAKACGGGGAGATCSGSSTTTASGVGRKKKLKKKSRAGIAAAAAAKAEAERAPSGQGIASLATSGRSGDLNVLVHDRPVSEESDVAYMAGNTASAKDVSDARIWDSTMSHESMTGSSTDRANPVEITAEVTTANV